MACPRHQERIAFSYTALSDKDEHHTTVDQGSYLFRILRTRNKFHIFKVFYKKKNQTQEYKQNAHKFPTILGKTLGYIRVSLL